MNSTFRSTPATNSVRVYLIIAVSIILGTLHLHAQQLFQKLYDSIDGDFMQAIRQTIDNGYIVTGVVNLAETQSYYPYLMKLKSDFSIDWYKRYKVANSDYVAYIQPIDNGNYVLAGTSIGLNTHDQDIYLIKVDGEGNIISTRNLEYLYNQFVRTFKATSEGGFLLGGRWANDAYLIKLDYDLKITWILKFGGLSLDYIYSCMETPDHDIVVAGYTYSFGAGDCDILLVRFNADGELLWSEAIGSLRKEAVRSDRALALTDDNGLVVAGYTTNTESGTEDILFFKLDESGKMKWARTCGGDADDAVFNIQQSEPAGFILTGTTKSFSVQNDDGFMLKTDSTGSFEWLRIYGGTGIDGISHQLQTADTGFVLCGHTTSFDTYEEAGYLIKTNNYGASGCQDRAEEFRFTQLEIIVTPIGTLQVENVSFKISAEVSGLSQLTLCDTLLKLKTNISPEIFELKQNYPNPFNPGTKIEYSLPGSTRASLKIYDIQGQQVRTLFENENKERGEYLVVWDGTDDRGRLVASGTYFYQLETDGMVEARKMIILK